MTTVTGFTSTRLAAMEAATIIDGDIVGNNLILTRHDGTTVDAGNVRGPTGSPGVTSGELATQLGDNIPIGVSLDYCGTSSPSANWLMMTGQTVVNAQTLYPTWWSRIPAGWKSGANAILPDTRKSCSVGYDSTDTDFNLIGKVGGVKTVTLTQANTPVKAHTHTVTDPGHGHTVNSHNHGGNTGNANPAHSHSGTTGNMSANVTHTHSVSGSGFPSFRNFVWQGDLGSGAFNFTVTNVGAGNGYDINTQRSTDGGSIEHQHGFSTGNTDIVHAHSLSPEAPGTNSVGTGISLGTGADASATPFSIVQPYYTMLKIIKVL